MNKNFVPFRIWTCRITQIRSCYLLTCVRFPFFSACICTAACAVVTISATTVNFVWIANSDIPVSDLLAPCVRECAHRHRYALYFVSHYCRTLSKKKNSLRQTELHHTLEFFTSSKSICRQWKEEKPYRKKNRKQTHTV